MSDLVENQNVGFLMMWLINDDPGLTLTSFTASSNFVTDFPSEKNSKLDFSETTATCDHKVGRYRHLIE